MVADIGAGTGYFTWRFAERVGPGGRVYATDVHEVKAGHNSSFLNSSSRSGTFAAACMSARHAALATDSPTAGLASRFAGS